MSEPLILRSRGLELRILPLGAALIGVRFAGQPRNLVLGFQDPSDHGRIPIYAGAIVGPVANRVGAGRVTLAGDTYQMPLNEAGKTTLHSGPDGLHAQTWEVQEQGPDHVRLRCHLPDGACGLPGNRIFHATYSVTDAQFTLLLEATTDQPTAINLAAHPYWNLDGRTDVCGHSLQVSAAHYLSTDRLNLPTGQTPTAGDDFYDFTTAQPVPVSAPLDVNYCLDADEPSAPAAVLTGSDGTTLRMTTTAPGLQVYNGAYLPPDAPPAEGFPPIAPFAAIALEPQHWPDAPNNPAFPQITLLPDQQYRQETRYELTSG